MEAGKIGVVQATAPLELVIQMLAERAWMDLADHSLQATRLALAHSLVRAAALLVTVVISPTTVMRVTDVLGLVRGSRNVVVGLWRISTQEVTRLWETEAGYHGEQCSLCIPHTDSVECHHAIAFPIGASLCILFRTYTLISHPKVELFRYLDLVQACIRRVVG